eukprot:116374_1
MSLNKAIQFRHLISQLTHQERVGFLSNLIDSCPDIIIISLFGHLSQSNQIEEVNAFNTELSDIIQSRKDKPAPLSQNIKLDQFPRAIIGYTASFLKQRDYIHFSMSNRSVYLGCSSPNTLQELKIDDIIDIKDYPVIKAGTFPSIQTLAIDPSKSMHFDSQSFNQVVSLRLTARRKRGWVQPFFERNIVGCDSVTTLDCVRFGCDTNKMDGNEFLSLLTKFPNLTHLKMRNVYLTEDITAQDITDGCPNVIGLSVMDDRVPATSSRQLPQRFASRLKYLSLSQHQKNSFDYDDFAFDKLEELQLFWPDNQLFVDIFKSTPPLKKLYIAFTPDSHWMSNDEVKNGIANSITKSAFLNTMVFSVRSSHLGSLLEGIERGLFGTKTRHRAELKISIRVRDGGLKPSDFTFDVARVINALEACDINDFMFIWRFKPLKKELDSSILMGLKTRHSKVFQNENSQFIHFIITNHNCKINGYQDSFAMENPYNI